MEQIDYKLNRTILEYSVDTNYLMNKYHGNVIWNGDSPVCMNLHDKESYRLVQYIEAGKQMIEDLGLEDKELFALKVDLEALPKDNGTKRAKIAGIYLYVIKTE